MASVDMGSVLVLLLETQVPVSGSPMLGMGSIETGPGILVLVSSSPVTRAQIISTQIMYVYLKKIKSNFPC